jgi:predicted XRE-type DNA-binding protein
MRKITDHGVTHGTGNIFADLGFSDPETHLLKARLVSRMQEAIEAEGLSQAQAAKRMGVAQPDVSRLLRGRFRNYSVERLMRLLTALGCEVEIIVRPKKMARSRSPKAESRGDVFLRTHPR